MTYNISEELDWILITLHNRKDKYLLESIVDATKDYSVADVHGWGAKAEYGTKYEKIKDLVKVRIHEAVELGSLDKALAGEILKTYYYKPFADDKPIVDAMENLSDDELIKKMGEMGWVLKEKK